MLLTAPGGATAVRSFGGPLTTRRHEDTLASGVTLNKPLGAWQLTGTVDASYDDTRQQIDRRTATSALVAAAAAGSLPIAGPLPALPGAGRDLADIRALGLTSLATLAGKPFSLPAGDASLTAKAGYAYSNSRSSDTRTAAGDVTLTRGDASAGLNLALPLTSRREGFLDALGDFTANLSAGVDRLSDFGTLTDWSTGLTWNPTATLNLQASYIVNEAAPTLAQLGGPTVLTYNVPVYDFTLGQAALVTVVNGGNLALLKEKQRDLKLALNWQLPFLQRSNLIVEYFRNRSNDVTESFPLLTPATEAAFPGRVVRGAAGQLVSIDRRPVTFSEERSSSMRWGFNLSGRIGSDARAGGGRGGGGGAGPGGSGGGGPPGGAEGGPPPGGGGGGPPGFMGRGGPRGGRWNLAVYHTWRFTDQVTIAPGGPVLDLLNGDATGAGGTPRHVVRFEGGAFYKGFGLRLDGVWNSPTRVLASGIPGEQRPALRQRVRRQPAAVHRSRPAAAPRRGGAVPQGRAAELQGQQPVRLVPGGHRRQRRGPARLPASLHQPARPRGGDRLPQAVLRGLLSAADTCMSALRHRESSLGAVTTSVVTLRHRPAPPPGHP